MNELNKEQVADTKKEVIHDVVNYINEQMDLKRCGDIVVSISIRDGIPTKIERKFCEHLVHYEKTKKFLNKDLITNENKE